MAFFVWGGRLMPKIPASNETLLLRSVVYSGDCWLRLNGVRPGTNANGGGYSRMYRGGRTVYSHRLAYETWVGPIPERMQVETK